MYVCLHVYFKNSTSKVYHLFMHADCGLWSVDVAQLSSGKVAISYLLSVCGLCDNFHVLGPMAA